MDSDSDIQNGAPEKLGDEEEEVEALPEDILNILLATDIHLGYAEKDPVRGMDSFDAFREILQMAKDNDVDMILLGGDLFHDSKPTTACLLKCMSLIREYCLGDKPVSLEFLSEQKLNFSHCTKPIVNYEDPNFNISIPIFSIHGNHDDPSGFSNASALDILSASGLVNYFGKQENLATIEMFPLLLSKGLTQLALYGLGHVKDSRLYRLFKTKKVHMALPSENTGDWFNMLVLHQKRVDRNGKETVSEEMLPDFLDMVFWGHEHGCRVDAEFNPKQKFYVIQPGSSVASSLSEDEAIPKKVAILSVHGRRFKLKPLPLLTVRPFLFDTISLSDCVLPTDCARLSDNVKQYVSDYVERMIHKARKLHNGDPRQPELPLVRLRVIYSDETQMFNTVRFGQEFAGRVANPGDIVLQRREKRNSKKEANGTAFDDEAMAAALRAEKEEDRSVEDIVLEYFNNAPEECRLSVLSVPGLLVGVTQFMEKDDGDAINEIIKGQMLKASTFLAERGVTEDNVDELITDFNAARNPAVETDEAKQLLLARTAKPSGARADSDEEVTLDPGSDQDKVAVPATTRGTSRRPQVTRGRGRATASGTGGRGKQPSIADSSSNGSCYGSVVGEPSQRKGLQYSDSDSD